MKSKRSLALILVIVLTLAHVSTGTARAQTSGPSQNSPEVILKIAEEPTNEDEHWKITDTYHNEYVDSATGLTVYEDIIYREAPAGDQTRARGLACPPKLNAKTKGKSMPAFACNFNINQTRTSIVTIGAVTGTLKHYASRWCNGGNCNNWQPYKVEVWWTRTSVNWTVTSAFTDWGCNLCVLCSNGSTWTGGYQSGFFTPTWSGNSTPTYIYTSSSFPVIEPITGAGGIIRGRNDSQVVSHSGSTPMPLHTQYP